MASSNENTTESKTCQCSEGDKSFWNTKASESSDKKPAKCPNCQILKSGPLFISSKGIGWTTWKKRWFVLTHTSLVFYRTDPNALPQRGSEANPTLGGIDLTNSGSVAVKEDKKLLTVSFPDGCDGRTFTLKGETIEELQEWKTALENALARAPSAALALGQSGIIRNEIADSVEASCEQSRDSKPAISMVVGRPVLLALEDVDGSPSFLEKALRFIEDYGIEVEGILRQSADVEEVKRRVHEYEQGKNEFSSDEDAHVIGDCIKHVLRELPSSPVPASCCTALVEAYRTDQGDRIYAIRAAISETFPEPNLRLLQRILKMMLTVASHKVENRMSLSALAACMAPLILRPLLAGDCEFEDNFNMGGDGSSLQLVKAAAAANYAQAIILIMLEEYGRIFDGKQSQDGSLSSDIYTESEEDDIDDEESTCSYILVVDGDDDGYHDARTGPDADFMDDPEHSLSGTLSGSSSYLGSDMSENEVDDHSSYTSSIGSSEDAEATEPSSIMVDANSLVQDIGQKPSSSDIPLTKETSVQNIDVLKKENSISAASPNIQANGSIGDVCDSSPKLKFIGQTLLGSPVKFRNRLNEPTASTKRPSIWGRTSARKNLSMESIDFSTDDVIPRLEATKSDLETKITKEEKGNVILQASIERRKEALCERQLSLQKDVEILREKLQKQRDLRASLESGLMSMRPGHVSITSSMNCKTRADLQEINLAEANITDLKQKVTDLRGQLSHHLQPSCVLMCISCKCLLDQKEMGLEEIVDIHQNEKSSINNIITAPSNIKDMITLSQTSLSSPKGQPKKKELPTSNQQTKDKVMPVVCDSSSKKSALGENSSNVSSAEEQITLNRNVAVKKREIVKKESQDSNSASKKSSKSEDATSSSSSSALTRLTNRLNFLKERRVQLANELQYLDVTPGPDPPSRTNSR